MNEVVIIDGVRTAVGKMGGTIKGVDATDLSVTVIKGILERTQIDPAEIDEIILGQCRQNSDEPNVARVAALRAGVPIEVPAFTVMRQCASGMTAVCEGAMSIMCGQTDVVLAGGVESMSMAPFYIRNGRYGLGTGNTQLLDSVTEAQFRAQPQELFGVFNMGMTAENVAEKYNVSREDQDKFSLASQQKAAKAISEGRFKDEIVPVVVPQRKGDPIIFEVDEFPRETSMEKLGKLKPVFRSDGKGTVTAGNSSGRNDGASLLLLTSAEKAKELGKKPIARIKGFATAGVDPRYMGIGPVPATKKALKNAGLTLDDIQLFELNEAFAAQSVACIRELGLENRIEDINVNGGAIALGHPVGSSGSRIIVTLINEMRKRKLQYGLATLCVAGGMGMATVIEAIY